MTAFRAAFETANEAFETLNDSMFWQLLSAKKLAQFRASNGSQMNLFRAIVLQIRAQD